MLNNPFCYTPRPSIVDAARYLTERIDSSPALHPVFGEGKMMGVLEVVPPDGSGTGAYASAIREGGPQPLLHRCPGLEGSMFLFAFSGLAGGSAFIEGFVPPIFEWKPEDIRSSSAEGSRRLQDWLFSNYIVLNGRGESRSIKDIFADRGLVPPGGTGDCAAPKLLQYALSHGLKPLSIGEFWYGASPEREVRRSGAFYPACTGKCGPLLGYMMQGLEVETNPLESDDHWNLSEPVVRYEDRELIVVEKPAGMLAVPGRPVPGIPPRRSLQDWLTGYCGEPVLACHRLDMDTSGLMVFAKTAAAQAALQRQFENREVTKAYLALVSDPSGGLRGRHTIDGGSKARKHTPDVDSEPGTPGLGVGREPGTPGLDVGTRGKIVLPLAPDWYDRPRQMVDPEHGKPAVTEYEILTVHPDGTVLVRLIPHTGRTHQLRVHCAHRDGLAMPIVGDRLYGGSHADRLMLHASYLSFRHPSDSRRLTFESFFSPVLT